MKTVRALIYRDVVWSVVFVIVAFVSLFFFIDFLEELNRVGRGGVTIVDAVVSALLELPYRFYEMFPIAALIGTIYAMARLAQSSEFTILRVAGLGPQRALRLLLTLGVGMAAVTALFGEVVAPMGEAQAQRYKDSVAARQAAASGKPVAKATAVPVAWLRERVGEGAAERLRVVSVAATDVGGALQGVRIYEMDNAGRLLTRIDAERAQVQPGAWRLEAVHTLAWPDARTQTRTDTATLTLPTSLDQRVVAAAVSSIDSMTTLELWRYSRHLEGQAQAAQRYELQFWKRVLYPLACVVMVMLALPFGYLHARSGGISYKVFGGILLGISFVLLNNVAQHVGLLRNWTPWLAAAWPSVLYLGLALGAFYWVVRYR